MLSSRPHLAFLLLLGRKYSTEGRWEPLSPPGLFSDCKLALTQASVTPTNKLGICIYYFITPTTSSRSRDLLLIYTGASLCDGLVKGASYYFITYIDNSVVSYLFSGITQLVLMALFWAAFRRDPVSHLKFPFLSLILEWDFVSLLLENFLQLFLFPFMFPDSCPFDLYTVYAVSGRCNESSFALFLCSLRVVLKHLQCWLVLFFLLFLTHVAWVISRM